MPLQRRPLLTLLSVGALGLTACPSPLPPGECGQIRDAGPSSSFTNPQGDLLHPGTVSTLVGKVAFGLCPPGYDYPTVTDITVTSPSGAVLSVASHRDHSGRIAVDFTSTELGEHPMQVTYTPDPVLGQEPITLPATVVLTRDRRDAARLTLPVSCDVLDRTALGAWICDGKVIRDGAVVQDLDAGWRFAVDGPSLWGATEDGQVTRWQDTGAGPIEVANSVPASGPQHYVNAMIGTGDEVLVRRGQEIQRYVMPADGGTPRTAVALVPSDWGHMARNGSELLAGELVPDDDPQRAPQQICSYRLEGDAFARTAAPCLTEEVVGSNADGLWVKRSPRIELYRAEDGGITHVAGVEGLGRMVGSSYPGDLGFYFNRDLSGFSLQAQVVIPVIGAGGGATLDAFPLRGLVRGIRQDFAWTDLAIDAGVVVTEVIFR